MRTLEPGLEGGQGGHGQLDMELARLSRGHERVGLVDRVGAKHDPAVLPARDRVRTWSGRLDRDRPLDHRRLVDLPARVAVAAVAVSDPEVPAPDPRPVGTRSQHRAASPGGRAPVPGEVRTGDDEAIGSRAVTHGLLDEGERRRQDHLPGDGRRDPTREADGLLDLEDVVKLGALRRTLVEGEEIPAQPDAGGDREPVRLTGRRRERVVERVGLLEEPNEISTRERMPPAERISRC